MILIQLGIKTGGMIILVRILPIPSHCLQISTSPILSSFSILSSANPSALTLRTVVTLVLAGILTADIQIMKAISTASMDLAMDYRERAACILEGMI